ncbi:MAG: ATP synthase F1 subunit delta [Candidatus Anammoxibacter sp.]
MTEDIVALGYSRALYDIASNSGQVDLLEGELKALDALLKESKDLENVMMHPGISLNVKKKLVENILAYECSSLLKKFLFVIIDKRREKLLNLLYTAYLSVVREVKGIVLAEVQSTIELTEENIGKLKSNLERAIGKEVEITTTINSKILGGLVIRFGDKLIDGSIRSKLAKLKKNLMQASPA